MKQLEESLAPLAPLREIPVPKGGWVKALREALGMGLEAFARRVGVTSPSAALKLERNAANGTITLRRLRDAADALGCDLIVGLVPRAPLLEQARQQAENQARERLKPVRHTMNMEAQPLVQADFDEMVSQLADDILRRGGRELWG